MVDYSKWKNIEVSARAEVMPFTPLNANPHPHIPFQISDDEDDTHPNIDTPSLFRWRHQARVERMAEMDQEKDELKKKRQSFQARLMDVKERISKKDGDEAALKVGHRTAHLLLGVTDSWGDQRYNSSTFIFLITPLTMHSPFFSPK